MSKARNIADLGSNDVLDTHANGLDVTGNVNINSNTSSASTANQLTLRGGTGNVVSGNVVGGINFDSFDLGNQNTSASISAVASGGHVSGSSLDTDLIFKTADGASVVNRLNIGHNGDIIMYKDDGTTAGVTFDASTGYTTFDGYVTVNDSVDLNGTLFPNSVFMADSQAIVFGTGSDAELSWGGSYLNLNTKGNDIRIMDGLTTKVHYDASTTSLGIGTDNPSTMLDLSAGTTNGQGGSHAGITMTNKYDTPDNSWSIRPSRDGLSNTGLEIRDVTDNRSVMAFDGSGNVGINHQSPAGYLDIRGNGTTNDRMLNIYTTGVGGGQTGNFYGARIHAQSNNSSSDTYGTYITGFQGVGNHYAGLYSSNTSTTNSHARAIGVWGDVLSNSGATHHGPSNSNYHIQAGVFALARTTNASTNSVNSALVARNLSSNGNTAYGAYIETIAGATNPIPLSVRHAGSEKLKVNASGHVTKPSQPVFEVSTVPNSHSVGSVVDFTATHTNIGNCWDNTNNRFVAPVNGMYQFNFSVFTHRTTYTGDFYWDLRKNGSVILRAYDAKDGNVNRHCQIMASHALYLTANQYVDLIFSVSPGNTGMEASGNHNRFSGFLIA